MSLKSNNRKKWLLLLILTAAALLSATLFCTTALLFYVLAPVCVQCPQNPEHSTAVIFSDRTGTGLHHFRGSNHRICFSVKLEDLPEHLIQATIAAEDRHFFEHPGVDLRAIFRAGFQMIRHKRIISGASTITMQLISMQEEKSEKTRSFKNKLFQAAKALKYEKIYTKKEILEQYFNALPYGGNIYGIEAAAGYYFGRHAKDLNLAESILLSGIPQAPSRLRPDRHPEAAEKRFRTIVNMLENQQYFTPEEAENVRKMQIRYRDFSLPYLPSMPDNNCHFFQLALSQCHERPPVLQTTYDSRLTAIALDLLKSGLPEDGTVQDAAMVVIENKTAKVRVLIGTLDFKRQSDGQVNAATAKRSPGSTLKPFIYGEAIGGGLIVADSFLLDAPLTFHDYTPGNFSGKFLGMVRADTALAESLNTPAIRLLRELGVNRMLKKMAAWHIYDKRTENTPSVGLSLALGGRETDLLSLTLAYSALPGNSLAEAPVFIENKQPEKPVPLWEEPAVPEMLLNMLRTHKIPNAEHLPVAWKTGTSNGFRDAWCFAVTPQYTVGVWYGNKKGTFSPHLVGVTIAAPVAGKMIAYLTPAFIIMPQSGVKTADLCKKSGLNASEFCSEILPGTVIRSIPLRTCYLCKKNNAEKKKMQNTVVRSPLPGTYIAKNGEVSFITETKPAKVHYYLDGKYIGQITSGSKIILQPGIHNLTFWGGDSYYSSTVEIAVQNDGK